MGVPTRRYPREDVKMSPLPFRVVTTGGSSRSRNHAPRLAQQRSRDRLYRLQFHLHAAGGDGCPHGHAFRVPGHDTLFSRRLEARLAAAERLDCASRLLSFPGVGLGA